VGGLCNLERAYKTSIKNYIYGYRGSSALYDLMYLRFFYKHVATIIGNSVWNYYDSFLMVNCNLSYSEVFRRFCGSHNLYYLYSRWVGGALTNIGFLTKSWFRHMDNHFEGIRTLQFIPAVLVNVSGEHHRMSLWEGRSVGSLLLGIADFDEANKSASHISSTADGFLDYPVLSNDDSYVSLDFYLFLFIRIVYVRRCLIYEMLTHRKTKELQVNRGRWKRSIDSMRSESYSTAKYSYYKRTRCSREGLIAMFYKTRFQNIYRGYNFLKVKSYKYRKLKASWYYFGKIHKKPVRYKRRFFSNLKRYKSFLYFSYANFFRVLNTRRWYLKDSEKRRYINYVDSIPEKNSKYMRGKVLNKGAVYAGKYYKNFTALYSLHKKNRLRKRRYFRPSWLVANVKGGIGLEDNFSRYRYRMSLIAHKMSLRRLWLTRKNSVFGRFTRLTETFSGGNTFGTWSGYSFGLFKRMLFKNKHYSFFNFRYDSTFIYSVVSLLYFLQYKTNSRRAFYKPGGFIYDETLKYHFRYSLVNGERHYNLFLRGHYLLGLGMFSFNNLYRRYYIRTRLLSLNVWVIGNLKGFIKERILYNKKKRTKEVVRYNFVQYVSKTGEPILGRDGYVNGLIRAFRYFNEISGGSGLYQFTGQKWREYMYKSKLNLRKKLTKDMRSFEGHYRVSLLPKEQRAVRLRRYKMFDKIRSMYSRRDYNFLYRELFLEHGFKDFKSFYQPRKKDFFFKRGKQISVDEIKFLSSLKYSEPVYDEEDFWFMYYYEVYRYEQALFNTYNSKLDILVTAQRQGLNLFFEVNNFLTNYRLFEGIKNDNLFLYLSMFSNVVTDVTSYGIIGSVTLVGKGFG
jgi:ribosomal protein S2